MFRLIDFATGNQVGTLISQRNSFLVLVACCLFSVLGCGGSGSNPEAPTGNDLQQHSSEHLELNDAVEPPGTTVDNVK